MHSRAYKKFARLHLYFSLPVILLSTVAGTANFATGSFPENIQSYVPLVTGAIGLISGAITTIAQFCKVPEQMEGHRAGAIDYGKLARSIEVELNLPINDRHTSGQKFVDTCRKDLERLQSTCPDIPLRFVRQFDRRFKKKGIAMPGILHIRPVQIYREPVSEEHIEIKRLADAEVIRAEAARQFQQSVEATAAELHRSRHLKRKQTVSAGSIASSMERLIGTIHAKKEALQAAAVPLPETGGGGDDDDSTPTLCSLGSADEEEDKDMEAQTDESPFKPAS